MLSLTLPLESDVTTDQMTINAHADLTRTYLGNVVMGRAITNGRIQIDATTQNLNLTGHAALSSLPSDVSYFMDFRALAPTEVAEKAHVITHITPATAIASGFAVGDHFYGNAELQTDYTRLANNTGKVELALNLTPAKFSSRYGTRPQGARRRFRLNWRWWMGISRPSTNCWRQAPIWMYADRPACAPTARLNC